MRCECTSKGFQMLESSENKQQYPRKKLIINWSLGREKCVFIPFALERCPASRILMHFWYVSIITMLHFLFGMPISLHFSVQCMCVHGFVLKNESLRPSRSTSSNFSLNFITKCCMHFIIRRFIFFLVQIFPFLFCCCKLEFLLAPRNVAQQYK